MSIVSWIIFGALAGWVASIIMGRSERMGCLANIIIGIIGAAIGGFLMSFLDGSGVTGFNLPSFVVAVLGAIVLLLITGWWSQQQQR